MDGTRRTDLDERGDDLARCTASMRALARQLLRDGAAAEDAAQEAWLVALEGDRPAEVPLGWWLRGVVRNVAWRLARSEGRRRRHEGAAARPERVAPTAVIAAQRAETHRRLMSAVLALDEPYRETLLLRFFEDLTPAEIAARSGEPAGTVRSRLKRGLGLLRARLDAEHAGDRRRWALALVPFSWHRPVPIATTALVAGGIAVNTIAKATVAAVLFVAAGGAALLLSPAEEAQTDVANAVVAPAAEPVPPERPRRTAAGAAVPSAGTGAIALTVVDWNSRPIAGARADVGTPAIETTSSADETVPAPPLASAVTGSDGTARIDGLAPGGPLEVIVTAAGRGRAKRIVQLPTSATPVPLAVRLVRECTLAGTVRERSGQPVADAVVEVRTFGEPRPWRAATGRDGRYAIGELPFGDVEVRVARAGGAPSDVAKPSLPFADALDFVLDPAARVAGTVRDGDTGRPLAGVRVTAGVSLTASRGSATSGSDGRFAIDSLGAGVVDRLDARRDGWCLRQRGAVAIPLHAGETAEYDVELVAGDPQLTPDTPPAPPLAPCGAIEGRVLDPDGAPVAFAWVGRAAADANGRFRIGSGRAGQPATWRVEAPGFVPATLAGALPPAGGTIERNVRLERAPRVRGRISLPNGAPPPEGTSVRVLAFAAPSPDGRPLAARHNRPPATVEADGRYAGDIGIAAPGQFRVEVRAPGHPISSSADRDVAPDGADCVVDVTIADGAELAGQALDAATGEPIAGARVVSLSALSGPLVATSGRDGRFVVHALESPTPANWIRVEAAGYLTKSASFGRDEAAVVRLERAREIAGIVTWADGRPVSGVALTLDRAARGPSGPTVVTSVDGRFEFAAVGPKTHRIDVAPALPNVDIQAQVLESVASGARDVRIVVAPVPGPSIAGRVLDTDGAGVAGAVVIVSRAGAPQTVGRAVTSDDGSFRVTGLPDTAHFDLVATPPGRFRRASRTAVPGNSTDVEIRVETGLWVAGVLVDETGRPMPSVRLQAAERTAVTDAAGAFRFEGLSPGVCTITVARISARESIVAVRGGDSVGVGSTGVRLTAVAGVKLTGVVVDEDGAPIEGASVEARSPGVHERAVTGADGRFEVAALPSSAVAVTASCGGRIPERVADAVPGGAPLRIVLRRGFDVQVRLLDAGGAPLAGVDVTLEHPTDPEMNVARRTGPDGRFGAGGLPKSTYRVWVYRGEKERADAGSVTTGSGDVVDITVK